MSHTKQKIFEKLHIKLGFRMHCVTSSAGDLCLFALLKLIIKLVCMPPALERWLAAGEWEERKERGGEKWPGSLMAGREVQVRVKTCHMSLHAAKPLCAQ